MQPIRTLDMFSGIGGFRSGLEAIGGFSFVGHCEIDKYANQAYEAIYQPKGELYYEDARKIDPDTLPDIDLICGGFPCQSFSIAGKRKGFDDTRGTLFFEIARIAAVKRPKYLLLENVPGLLSHDSGRTFATIPMQGNRHIGGQVYAGPLFIVGDNGMGEFCDLTDKQVEKYKELFADPEDISPEEVESDFGYYITGI